jgi:carboxylesterase type B
MDEEGKEKRGVPDSAEPIFKAFRMGSYSVGPMSEDCLTLNVWTKPQTGEAAKAVIVWIHGGSFRSGSSRIPIYNGKHIADQDDVVVVSFKCV